MDRRDRQYYSGLSNNRGKPTNPYRSESHNSWSSSSQSSSNQSNFFSPSPAYKNSNNVVLNNGASLLGFHGRGGPAPVTASPNGTSFAATAKKNEYPAPSYNFAPYITAPTQSSRIRPKQLDLTAPSPTDFPTLSNPATVPAPHSTAKPLLAKYPSSILPTKTVRPRPPIESNSPSVNSPSPILSISPNNKRKPATVSARKKPKNNQQLLKDFGLFSNSSTSSSTGAAASAAVPSGSGGKEGVDRNNNKHVNGILSPKRAVRKTEKAVLSEQEFDSRSNTPTKGLLPIPVEQVKAGKKNEKAASQKSLAKLDKEAKKLEKAEKKRAKEAKATKLFERQLDTPQKSPPSFIPQPLRGNGDAPPKNDLDTIENTPPSTLVDLLNAESFHVNEQTTQKLPKTTDFKTSEDLAEIVWNKATECRLLREMGWTGSDDDLDIVEVMISDSEIQEFWSSQLAVNYNGRRGQQLSRAGSECD